MKINNMFLIGLFLLAILSIGAVSASENITLNDGGSLSVVADDDDFDYDDFDGWEDDDAYQMDVNAEDEYVYYKDDLYLVNLTLPSDACGNLAVYEGDFDGDGVYLCEFPLDDNGHVEVKLSQIPLDNESLLGFHDFIFVYEGDDYNVDDGELFLTVVDYEVSGPKYINLGGDVLYRLDLKRNTHGILYVETSIEDIDGEYVDVGTSCFDVIEGVCEFGFNDLKMGTYYFDLEFKDDELYIEREVPLYVLPKIKAKDKVVIGVDDILTIDLPNDVEGTFSISLYSYLLDNYQDISASYSGGKIKLSSMGLLAGEYDILNFEIVDFSYGSISFEQTPTFESNHGIFTTFKAVNPTGVTVTASNFNTVYTAGGNYKVKVTINGKVAKGAIVVFKIDDVEVKTTKTDKNGYASLKITKAPGTYKITTVALGKTVTKTLTVKHLLSLTTVKVKKSATSLVLTASLAKVNGKYLANKQIKFKFNGVTYTKSTNSKGIAQVTIPKKVLNKLKPNKKVSYQASYLSDTVKKTAKISK